MPALNARLQDALAAPAVHRPEMKTVDYAFAMPGDRAAAASPALALQRQLGDAVLQGWCQPRLTAEPGFTGRQMAIVALCAAASWAAMFGAGWALLA